jgi:peptidoglycan/LPS O-acetylase OafA/YrhL
MKSKSSHHTHQKLQGLDHLRALAIIMVFFFHYFIISSGQPEWLPGIAKFGWTGVDLFFVLSGFLISSQLFSQIKQGKLISIKQFFVKRFFRIIPAFLLTVGLYFIFPIFREKETLPPIWKFLTFTQNFGLNLKEFGTFSHAWSLCVEEHFYLLLPLTLLFLQHLNKFKNSYWILLLLFLFGFAIRFYSYEYLYLTKTSELNRVLWHKYIFYPTYNRLDGLLIGVAIAGMNKFSPVFWGKISNYGNQFIALSLLVMTSAYFLCEDQFTFNASIFGFPLVSFGYGLLVVGAISPSSFLYRWNSRVTTLIATLSYAIYLTHKGIIHITHQLFMNYITDSNILLLICVISCVLGALLINLIVEKPFMKLRNKTLELNKTYR